MEDFMNKVKFNRLLLAGLVTFIVWIIIELLVEQVIGRMLFGNLIHVQWLSTNIRRWGIWNNVLNTLVALVNCMLLIWLYASLRPMFGVGTKTALITSAFGVILGLSVTVNGINLGLFPAKLGLVEWIYELVEFPIAMIAGAMVYEGESDPAFVE
jgi:hypothetical protein